MSYLTDITKRLPWEPLEQRLTLLLGCRRHLHGCTCLAGRPSEEHWVSQPCWSLADAAAVLGVHRRTVVRMVRDGLDWRQADLAACAAGLTPDRIWDDWETISAADADRIEEDRTRRRAAPGGIVNADAA